MRRLRGERGQSVIELMVSASVLLVIVGATLAVLDTATRTERAVQTRADVLDDMRTAMQRMTREIRQAVSVDLASTRSRIDMQTLIDGTQQRVVYEVVSGQLRRGTGGPGDGVPLLDGVEETSVFCYDPPDCLLDGPTAAGTPVIGVLLVAKPAVSASEPITLNTQVKVRNA